MIISDRLRLLLYILMAIFPIWLDFFKMSTDFSLRGLAMPILASLNAAVVVALAKTSSKRDMPMEVTAPKGKPLPTVETKPQKRK